MLRSLIFLLLVALALGAPTPGLAQPVPDFRLNDRGYFERGGVNVMVFQDIYPEGHQSGMSVIQHSTRLATGGDLRLEPTPGQWQPVPAQGERTVDPAAGEIATRLAYPDPTKDRTGFNPVVYPDLDLAYTVRVRADGAAVRVVVDLDEPLPSDWVGRVGFNLELFPGALFGKGWYLGGRSGLFPRQPNGPVRRDADGEMQVTPMATGPRLTVAPEDDALRLHIESLTSDLVLLDGRAKHNNGWFVVRSLVPAGAAAGAVEWIVTPHAIPGWRYKPVVQVSQVGYHPDQPKRAVIELDRRDPATETARLLRVTATGGFEEVRAGVPAPWDGRFLRYAYRHFDFSDVTAPGVYVITYGAVRTAPFRIDPDVYARDVWQPTVDYFLPVQMCHMRVEQQYRVWHGLCHQDDARMAPVDSNHFDGYVQGPTTLTPYAPGERVPGLDVGGWHDAGDDDLRIESQADEVHVLASMAELFSVDYDNTTIDQAARLVRIHQPDGMPDLLQQVEHGILSILGGYEHLGRLYRGVIVPTNAQYVLLGDWANQTDNLAYDPTLAPGERTATTAGVPDDRLVFTEEHAGHEYKGIAALAIAGRVLRAYNPDLAARSTAAAEALWQHERPPGDGFSERIGAATELLLTTGKPAYRDALVAERDQIVEHIDAVGWRIGRALPLVEDATFVEAVRAAVARHAAQVAAEQEQNPYGVPYEPYIWGAGWGIQRFGMEQYLLHHSFPDLVGTDYLLNALTFILGVHPGTNTASYASGVGATSITTAYGFNRADWSYIPGGVVSGTALIRPDFPELKDFPYLWQQAEYVMGGGATHFTFLVLAAEHVLNK